MSTTSEIAESLANIFRLFVKIGYTPAENVKYGPHTDEDLDISAARQCGMNNVAIDVLKSVPWLRNEYQDLIVSSKALCFSDKQDLKASRKLSTSNAGLSLEMDAALNGSWLSLTIPRSALGKDMTGVLLVLDASDGTLRRWNGFEPKNLQDVPSRPAHEVLNEIYEIYHSLRQIPYENIIFEEIRPNSPLVGTKMAQRGKSSSEVCQDEVHSDAYWRLKRVAEAAGWPGLAFVKSDFSKDAEKSCNQLRRKRGVSSLARAPNYASGLVVESSSSSEGSNSPSLSDAPGHDTLTTAENPSISEGSNSQQPSNESLEQAIIAAMIEEPEGSPTSERTTAAQQ